MALTQKEHELWAGIRIVVVDTETTGLEPTDRIISVGMCILEDGVRGRSWGDLVNPGVPSSAGALGVHHLDEEDLGSFGDFARVAPTIRGLLYDTPKTVYLAGHRTNFDAQKLFYEFAALGEPLPDAFLMLDTKTLAPAAGFGNSGYTLAEFAAVCGTANPYDHDAMADAITTREVILVSLSVLASRGITDLTPYLEEYRPDAIEPREPLTDEHTGYHQMNYLLRKEREKALEGCLSLSCENLHTRIANCGVDAKSAREVYEWVCQALTDQSLTRYQRGLLAAGGMRTLLTWRTATKTPVAGTLVKRALTLLNTSTWVECQDPLDLCDRCDARLNRNEEHAACRFVKLPRSLLFVCLYDNNDDIPEANAHRFIYGTDTTPFPSKSWFSDFKAHSPHAALSGATASIRILRTNKKTAAAMDAAKRLWRSQANRTPSLTDVYAALREDEQVGTTAGWKAAIAICDAGLRANQPGDWEKIEAKKRRLERRLAKSQLSPPENPRNTRKGPGSAFIRP